ncbi:MAG: hypothetical protein ACYTG3_12970 [Planctomycetota bacterium]|jgi:hypothetical protein
MRVFARAAAMILLAGAAGAGDKARPHPHFDDGGTIPWYTKLAEAKAAAKKQGKLVFIEYGREL